MKKERRIARAVALITAIITVFALTSCKVAGNNADEGSSNSNPDYGFTSEIESYSQGSNIRDISSIDLGEVETIVDKSGEPYITPNYNYRDRTVTFLSHWYPEDCLHLITYMDKYGGPQIKFLTYNYGDCGMKLQAMVLAENAPDVYKLRIGDLTTLLFANVWSDVTDKFDWNNRNWRDLKPFMKYCTINGRVMAAPEVNANYMVWFNKTIFEEYGVEDPLSLWNKGQWTKDNFDKICRKLTIREGGNTTIYGFGFDHRWFYDILGMYGTDFAIFDGSKYVSNTDDSKLADAFAYISQMNNTEKLWCAMNKANAYFASGKLAMLYYGNWLAMSDPYRSMAAQGKIDFVPVPENTATGLGPRQDYYVEGHAIPVGAKHVDEARAFIEIFNFYKQTPELDMTSTLADCELNGLTLEQFYRMRAPRYYKNPYTAIILTDWDPAFEEAMKGESWYKIRAAYDPKQQLVLDSLPSLNN
ncbi:MAG: extracellular solute-binding protein [Clostridia bacterium]|nr:extracellular solute-binding protein [Clostridia bacterium]